MRSLPILVLLVASLTLISGCGGAPSAGGGSSADTAAAEERRIQKLEAMQRDIERLREQLARCEQQHREAMQRLERLHRPWWPLPLLGFGLLVGGVYVWRRWGGPR